MKRRAMLVLGSGLLFSLLVIVGGMDVAGADVRQGRTTTVNGKPACDCTSTLTECGCIVEVGP